MQINASYLKLICYILYHIVLLLSVLLFLCVHNYYEVTGVHAKNAGKR